MAPERVRIDINMVSDTQVDIARHYARTRAQVNVKLVPNLRNKTRYVTRGHSLKFYLDHGMSLKKVHRVIKFNQSAWIEPYVMMNTWMRMKAINNMEKDFHKLMNIAVYGKACENQRKRNDIHLVTENEKAERLMDKPHCLDVRMFDERLLGIEMQKVKMLLKKPS